MAPKNQGGSIRMSSEPTRFPYPHLCGEAPLCARSGRSVEANKRTLAMLDLRRLLSTHSGRSADPDFSANRDGFLVQARAKQQRYKVRMRGRPHLDAPDYRLFGSSIWAF